MADKKFTAEMYGEAFREAGTLLLVFAPLYQLFEPYKPNWIIFLLVMLIGIVLLEVGIKIERKRA